MPTVAMHWEKYFQHIREKYNSIYKEELPLITPHVCSHMASAGINPKHLQYLMGHSDLSVTKTATMRRPVNSSKSSYFTEDLQKMTIKLSGKS